MKYLDDCTMLCGKIFAAMHITAGLPPRGSEGTTVKVENTAQVLRNIFIVNGRMAIIFEYNKSRAANNRSFFIVRFLPADLGQLVFCYLAYIWLFSNFLCKQVGVPHYRSNEFLFPDPRRKQKHMSSLQATEILRHLTHHMATPMTISLYRQASVAIAKRYISKLIQNQNFYEPADATEPINMIAMGVGNNPRTMLNSYAIDKALPTRLQSELLELYLRLSTMWQEWNKMYFEEHCNAPQAARDDTRPDRKRRAALIIKPDLLTTKRLCEAGARNLLLQEDGFQYDQRYRVLICFDCGAAVIPGRISVDRHLRKHNIVGELKKTLHERFKDYDLAEPLQSTASGRWRAAN